MDHTTNHVSLPWFGIPRLLPYLRPYKKMLLGMVFMGFQYTAQTTFKALKCVRRAIFFSLFRKAIIITPLVLILPEAVVPVVLCLLPAHSPPL